MYHQERYQCMRWRMFGVVGWIGMIVFALWLAIATRADGAPVAFVVTNEGVEKCGWWNEHEHAEHGGRPFQRPDVWVPREPGGDPSLRLGGYLYTRTLAGIDYTDEHDRLTQTWGGYELFGDPEELPDTRYDLRPCGLYPNATREGVPAVWVPTPGQSRYVEHARTEGTFDLADLCRGYGGWVYGSGNNESVTPSMSFDGGGFEALYGVRPLREWTGAWIYMADGEVVRGYAAWALWYKTDGDERIVTAWWPVVAGTDACAVGTALDSGETVCIELDESAMVCSETEYVPSRIEAVAGYPYYPDVYARSPDDLFGFLMSGFDSRLYVRWDQAEPGGMDITLTAWVAGARPPESVGDILAYLDLWVLDDLGADVDGSGGCTVGDIFDYLAVWGE